MDLTLCTGGILASAESFQKQQEALREAAGRCLSDVLCQCLHMFEYFFLCIS